MGRTVGAMDGAIEPPRTGLRRVLPIHTAPPATESPLLPLTLSLPLPLPLPLIRQVQGAGLPNTPTAPNARSGRNRAD
jgi:hypothetical protein